MLSDGHVESLSAALGTVRVWLSIEEAGGYRDFTGAYIPGKKTHYDVRVIGPGRPVSARAPELVGVELRGRMRFWLRRSELSVALPSELVADGRVTIRYKGTTYGVESVRAYPGHYQLDVMSGLQPSS